MNNNKSLDQLKDILSCDQLSALADDPEIFEELAKYEAQVDDELLLLLDDESEIEGVTLEKLRKSTFEVAHKTINRLTLQNRIKILEELYIVRQSLYEAVKNYGEPGFGNIVTPAVFKSVMGKIKHLEILQTWLYGIK